MKNIREIFTVLSLLLFISKISCQNFNEVRILVRADDIGMTRSANKAIIEAYKKGIVTSTEIMVTCPWFEEAAELLNANPRLDVGVHLTLTSEWKNMKWRPLTDAKSITDEDGYFFPFVWQNATDPKAKNLMESNWDIQEIERELRAQIELAKKRIPHVSHLSTHMAFQHLSEDVKNIYEKLAKEYRLRIDALPRITGWSGKEFTFSQKVRNLSQKIENLKPGDYMIVVHPAFDDLESQGLGHIGYDNVAKERSEEFKILTHKKIKRIIQKKEIKLITFKDLMKK